ncbi:MAG: ATP-binding protein [Lachnospiraceae bacterium]|nr:ATP-binding protein [Lachnospiraceae bacterium]
MILKDNEIITCSAVDDNLPKVQMKLNELMEKNEAPMKALNMSAIALEEMFINVCHYAYIGNTGDVTTEIQIYESDDEEESGKCVRITLTDNGIPYDPLAKDDPDVTLSAEERGLGGLGIYMVKKSMDSVLYEYMNGKNIFTMEKKF